MSGVVNEDFDVAVVGSGVGGAIAAAYLAKAGFKTIVFESFERIGGLRYASFERDGFKLDRHIHLQNWGVSLNDGEGNYPLAARETGARIQFEVMPPNGIWMNDGREVLIPFCGDGWAVVEFMEKMNGQRMPDESRAELAKVADYGFSLSSEEIWSKEFDETPAVGWLASITKDPVVTGMLRHLIAMTLVVPDDVALERGSIMTLATCVIAGQWHGRHQLTKNRGTTADDLPQKFCDVVTRYGGRVLASTPVKQIVIENGEAKGVVAAGPDGQLTTYKTKYVVSAVNYPQQREIMGANIPKDIDDIITDLYRSDTVGLDLHFALDEKVLPHNSSQLMLVTDEFEYDGVIATFSNLDPAWVPAGKQAIDVQYFLDPWEYEKQSSEYWFNRMEKSLFKRWPHVEPHVEWTERFTVTQPVHHAGIYAVKKLPIFSGIRGLYFAGDTTVGTGYFTDRAASSGMESAKAILKLEGKL